MEHDPARQRPAIFARLARGRRIPLLLACLAVLTCGAVVAMSIQIRTDMSDFLPAGDGPAGRLMRGELREGAAASLILAGIEGADPAELARISVALDDGLRDSGQFAFVANGKDLASGADVEWLFHRRYLLSPAVTAESFTAVALRASFERLLAGLQGSASPLFERFGFADPTGAFLALANSASGGGGGGGTAVRTRHGVWFAPDRDRALLVARSRAGGLDIAAQDRAIAAAQAAFAAARPGGARLLLSGPAVFAHEAAHAIQHDVTLLSTVSALLVAALLVWRFRSLWVMAAIAVPIGLSVIAAALAVQLVFGFVHGVTIGFGMTMLGITVDYPVLLIGHRKRGEAASGTLRRIGTAFSLAVAAAALGLTGMTFSAFPGLSQLGVFAVTGVLTAAAVTRWLLPPLIVAADLAPVSAEDPATLRRVERLRAGRIFALPLVAAAAAVPLLGFGPLPEHDLAALSPIPEQARSLDASLRADLGLSDTDILLFVRGTDAESVLRREEALLPRFAPLIAGGVLTGADAADLVLPSVEMQERRRAMLPDDEMLAARIVEAARDMPFSPGAFEPFLQDVAASRAMQPVLQSEIGGSLLHERIAPLLFARDSAWYGIVVPRGVSDAAALVHAIPADQDLTWLNMREQADRLLTRATGQAWRWLAGGAAAAVITLAVALWNAGRLVRVAGAVGAALLVTYAVLGITGARLSLVHIVALQLVAGVGLNYALFFARRQLDEEERSRTLYTLVTCNAMSLLTFGLLTFCRTPLLRDIGQTTAVGVVSAMVFAFLFAGDAPAAGKAMP